MKAVSLQRINAVLAFSVLTVLVLYVGRPFLVPLAFAGILAMLLLPVSRWLESRGVGRVGATLLCILLVLLVMAAFVGIIYAQVTSFVKDWPQIQSKGEQVLRQAQGWVQQQFGLDPQEQIQKLKQQASKLSQSSGGSGGSFFSGLMGLLSGLVLVTLYLFFLLWKREKYEEFILKLCAPESRPSVEHALGQITRVSARYLTGRLMSMAFLAVFYSIGLSIVGLKNAVLMSLIAVIPTLIPYVGAFIGASFPLFMALVSGSPDQLLPTAAVLMSAQIIDNNIIEPLVMGAELDLSPFFTVVAIVLGELIWGIPGMILFEPLFSILRIVCTHIPALHPYSFLLENEVSEPGWIQTLKKKFGK
ncbi:AI-2E family transporter [Larkinella soli]|uniref:AI-2E family transporter n=1 Tax=Larkinella soli TaxID=1770527 RepID=UPI000FFC978A|nr:AI-2E family transporter [Larkinella soli]